MRRILFVCARNRLRSLTAEAIFAGLDGVSVSSAGTAPDAECVVSADLLEWADVVMVMERKQLAFLRQRFKASLAGKRVVCLRIPDRFELMQPELVALLKAKVMPILLV